MKTKTKAISLLLATVSVALCGITACGESKAESPLKSNTYDGAVIDLTPVVYQKYLGLTKESDLAKCLAEHQAKGKFSNVVSAQKMTFSWESSVAASRYTLKISDKKDFSNEVFTMSTNVFYGVVDNLVPGTYYWKVEDDLGNETAVDSFTVADYVRAMDVDGIRNFRDIGGWKTENGKKIKYGLSYRCGVINATSGDALKKLGVKTEVDLRADDVYDKSAIPESYGINFLQAGIMQADYVLKDKSFYSSLTPEQIEEKRHAYADFKQEYADALYNAFKLYTDESNYPIVFHCTSGADRTGTFAFLLEGMLGVEVEDLYKDFELTSFAMGGKRWRSNIEIDGDGNYYFNDDGYVTVSDNYIAIGLLYKGLMECYSTGDGKLSSAIKNYLKTDVGLTDGDFQAIESIMLE